MKLPPHMRANDALTLIRAQHIDALPATLFSSRPLGYEAIRMAFSLYDEKTLHHAGTTIAAALT
jgi:DNA-binding transcriptional MocR family regulator